MARIAPLTDVKRRLNAYIEESQTEARLSSLGMARPLQSWSLPLTMMMLESLVLARSPRPPRLLKKSRASIAASRGLSAKEF